MESLLFLFQGEVVAESKQEAEAVARICNWSSRPENVPPTAFIIKRPKRNRMCSKNTDKNDKDINTNLLKLLLPSLVLTHILMLGLGWETFSLFQSLTLCLLLFCSQFDYFNLSLCRICIGRRLSTKCSVIWVIAHECVSVYAVC